MAKAFDRVIAPFLHRIPLWISPNHLTFVRVLHVIPVVYLAPTSPWLAVALHVDSALFDILDGPLARLRKIEHGIGAILDPMADKIAILVPLFLSCPKLFFWQKLMIAGFELLLVAIRPIKTRLRVPTNSNAYGALKTWSQSFFIAFELTQTAFFHALSWPAFCAAILFALLSLFGHLKDIRDRKVA